MKVMSMSALLPDKGSMDGGKDGGKHPGPFVLSKEECEIDCYRYRYEKGAGLRSVIPIGLGFVRCSLSCRRRNTL